MNDDSFCELYPWAALCEALGGMSGATYEYDLAAVLVLEGQAQLLSVVPVKGGAVAVFKTLDGEVFTVFNPRQSKAELAETGTMTREGLKAADVAAMLRFLGGDKK